MAYDRKRAVDYAHQWAFSRNPRYLDFSKLGGDCTNFISQALHAGGASMNYRKTFGWYYNSAGDRAPAWTGAQFLYNFLIANQGPGPYAVETTLENLRPGDIVQLSFTPGVFSHSLLVVSVGYPPAEHNILIATHSYDSDYRPLDSYQNVAARRYLQIEAR